MNINLSGLKQDYSFLFSSMNSSNNSSNNLFTSINLSDYNSIKTGTYGKLLKAYYKKEDTEETKETNSKKTTADKINESSAKELKEVQTEANDLRDSAAALMQKGSKSVFKDEDMKKVYSAVSEFVNDYNSVIEKGTESDSKAVVRGAEGLVSLAGDYEKELNQMGITIDKNNKLSIDKDTFMKADINKVKELFNGQNSFSYLASVRAVSIGNTAYSESNKSNLYSGDGNYSTLTTGDLFNSIV